MIDWTTPTPEDVEKILEKWGPVISHFMQLFREKGNTYLDFLEGVWLWSQRSADGERDVAISATMVKDLSILRDAYLSQAQELEQANNTMRLLMRVDKERYEDTERIKSDNQSLREQISALEGHIVGEEVEP